MSFENAVEYVIQNEGGFVDNPKDPGRATNFGITIMLLAMCRNKPVTPEDVKALTKEDAEAIYKSVFWDHMKLDSLPEAIGTALLDTAVNQGETMAVRHAQSALGFGVVDGVLGSKTVEALNRCEVPEFMFGFVGQVQDHYIDIVAKDSSKIIFLKGWLTRARRLFHLI